LASQGDLALNIGSAKLWFGDVILTPLRRAKKMIPAQARAPGARGRETHQ
jgi:hypothetical protein